MKFKLKAKAEDWLIFFIFAILLLFVVSIFVTNLHSFATTGEFAGANPFTAFKENFSALMLFYFLAVAFLFYSVKGYFFDAEKGFGLSTDPKDDNGYSRWSTDKEIKKDLIMINVKDKHYKAAGFPIINNGKQIWVDDGESHNLVIGSTGTGKTQCIIHPLIKILTKAGESMIVTDPKGEIYAENAGLLKEEGYNIVVLNFRDPQKGNTWNPLASPYKLYKEGQIDKAMEILDDLALNILYEEGKSSDPFWEKAASDYFVGLTLGLFEDAEPDQINLNSLSMMDSRGEEKFGVRSNYIKEYFKGKEPSSSSYIAVSGTVFAPEETKMSIISTFKQKIRVYASRENLSEMLSQNDFDLGDIGKQKTAVFMVIQDEKRTYHALATVFIKQCYESLIDVAHHSPNGELPIRTNFVLDEFANMPPFKDITTMITAARSRLIRFTMIIQNFAQLDAVYGKENAQTIRSNCNNMMYLLTTELAALREISELCGEKKVKVGKGDKEHEENRPLITVSQLQRMDLFQAVVNKIRSHPYKTSLQPNFKMDWGHSKQEADPFIERKKKPIKIFDLKIYIDAKKKKEFLEEINSKKEVPKREISQMEPPQKVQPKQKFAQEDFLKRLDEELAKLEKAEKSNKSKEEIIIPQKISETKNPETKVGIDDSKREQVKESEVKEVFNNTVTDDQFFDDFFDE